MVSKIKLQLSDPFLISLQNYLAFTMNSFYQASFGLALASISFFSHAYSQESDPSCSSLGINPANLAAVDGFCTLTPERYEVNLYEMGLCTSNPIIGNSFSKDSCIKTISNTSAVALNMANGNSYALKSQNKVNPPKPGTYGYAYVILEDDFKLQFSYTLGDKTFYSNGTDSSSSNPVNNVKTSAPSLPFIETLNDFGDPEEGFRADASAIVTGGTINALLTDSNLQSVSSSASVTRLIGVYVPTSKVNITEETEGLEVKFVVTDQGGGLEVCQDEGGPIFTEICRFGSGPFSARFETF